MAYSLISLYFSIALKLAYNRSRLFKNLHYWSRDMLNFDFLDKGLGIVSQAHFVYHFSTKIFLMLYSNNWPNFIAWLPLLLETLGNMCITIIYYPGCDVMGFEINLIFLIEPFFLHDQKVVTKTWISWEQKKLLRWSICIIFKGLSVTKNCLRP